MLPPLLSVISKTMKHGLSRREFKRQKVAEFRAHRTHLSDSANELAISPDKTQTVELHILTADTSKGKPHKLHIYFAGPSYKSRLPRSNFSFLRPHCSLLSQVQKQECCSLWSIRYWGKVLVEECAIHSGRKLPTSTSWYKNLSL